jgi:LuxR family maltose regulon positive regulatory protein
VPDKPPLLATKLFLPPTRATLVSRPRLTARFNAGLTRPLTLLTAPAGSGKTTLVSEWRASEEGRAYPLAWLSLDADDNDPARFLTYLIAAVATVRSDFGEAPLALLHSAQPAPAQTIIAALISELCALEAPLALVLDDFHLISAQPVTGALTYLLDHIPPRLRLVILTRADPPLPLARLRARDQLTEIRAADLRFTTDEAAAFLNQIMRLDLSPADVLALEARTEGWIAGLQLAALSMQGRRDVASFVRAFTGSQVYVAEYLVEEVLQRQPEEVQAFLLQTSILERLNSELGNAVAGRQDGQEVLAALNRANLFVVPLDDAGRWFRYHHLFGDLLQARLGQAWPPEAIAGLHQRAAAWYEQHEFVAEAVNHRLAARDFDEAARLIGQNASQLLTRGQLATLRQWTEGLPAPVIQSHPQIIIAKVWALTLAGDIRQVEPLLKLAESQIEASGETPAGRELAGFAAAIRAFFAMMAGENARALELAERAESLLPEHSVHARWLLPYTLGAAYRGQGRYEKAAEAFARQVQMGEAHENLIVWGTGVTAAAIVRRLQGRLREAADTCRQALQRLAERGAMQFGSLAKLEVPLVDLCEQNALDEARQRLAGVRARMQGWPMPTDQLHALLALIQLQQAEGDLPGAFETLRTAKDLKATHPVILNLARSVDLSEIRLSLETGDLAEASRLMEALQPGASSQIEFRDQELLMLARLRLAQGRPDEADSILSAFAIDLQAGERKGSLIEALVLQACARQAQGDQEAALPILTRALALAEPEGYARVFVDQGAVMQQLLPAVVRKLDAASDQAAFPSQSYVAKLLGAFPAGSTPEAPPRAPDMVAGLVERLTPRELEVLLLIAAGDSNRAIADKLVISVSAVKKHTGNIFGKLNVGSRTQALARARQLGLLSPDG